MADKQESLSIIDKDCLVEGTVNIEGKLIVAGSLKGTLKGNTVITVEGSRVDAPAKVRELIIGGEFEGDITVYENLRIRRTGSFSGKITCKNLTLEAGGKLEGGVKPLDATQSPATYDTALAVGGAVPASLGGVKGGKKAKDDEKSD